METIPQLTVIYRNTILVFFEVNTSRSAIQKHLYNTNLLVSIAISVGILCLLYVLFLLFYYLYQNMHCFTLCEVKLKELTRLLLKTIGFQRSNG